WLQEDRDFIEGTPYRLGVYGHTPVRGGVNVASQGRALLLDTNGHLDEYAWLEVEIRDDSYRLKLHGNFFDEIMPREAEGRGLASRPFPFGPASRGAPPRWCGGLVGVGLKPLPVRAGVSGGSPVMVGGAGGVLP